MGDTRELREVAGGFPRSEDERALAKAAEHAKTREQYVAALMAGGSSRADAEAAADWVGLSDGD